MQNGSPTSVLVIREHDSVWAEDAKLQVLDTADGIHTGLAKAGCTVVPLQVQSPQLLPTLLKPFDPRQWIIFNWFEGVVMGATDSVRVAAEIETLGFTFTGANAQVLETTQNKLRTQRTLTAHAIPVPRAWSVSEDNLDQWKHYPAILKVANEHGSEALTHQSVVHNLAGLRTRFEELRDAGYDDLMISEFVAGREFTVSLWGNGSLQSLPLLEVDFSAYPSSVPRIRSASAKWETESQDYQLLKLVRPQDLNPELHDRIERVARLAYLALHLRDYGRIDIRLHEGVPYVIDVNCNPDLEHDGSFTIAAELGGFDYSSMLAQIVQFASYRRNGAY